ncbi:MAG: hypothetical protein ACRDYC_13750, partial [Acidimicrobiales bacterium]
VVVVLYTGVVEKRALELAEEHTSAQITAASVRLSSQLDGALWGSPLLLTQTGDRAVDRLVARALEALASLASAAASSDDHAFVGGAARMASAFTASETARQVMEILEQRYVLSTLLASLTESGLSVAIGTEHGLAQLADCSIVVAPYQVEGEQAGSVGILGPTRMHYSQVLAAVAMVSRRLSRALSEGSSEQ